MARAPRRSFANPFVLTLAAIPSIAAGCTVQSSPQPQGPTQTHTSNSGSPDHHDPDVRDHRRPDDGQRAANDPPRHVNPPGPHTNPPSPQWSPSHTPTPPNTPQPPVGNPPPPDRKPQPMPTANPPSPKAPGPTPTYNPPAPRPTGSPDVAPKPTQNQQAPVTTAPKATGRTWTIFNEGKQCSAMLDVKCPEGATCNPPPPAKYACPKNLGKDATIKVFERDGACVMDPPPSACPPNAKCTIPKAEKVACPTR